MTALTVAQAGLVIASGIPEFAIGNEQTHALGKACVNVARHYPSYLSAKQQDIVALVFCVGSIGMTQVGLYNMRMAQSRAEQARDITPEAMQ